NYKDPKTLIHYLVKTAGLGANLLLNIGPQPSGELPVTAVERLSAMGEWMDRYGETVYGTTATPVGASDWGTSTMKGNRLFLHVLRPGTTEILLPSSLKVKKAFVYDSNEIIRCRKSADGITLSMQPTPDVIDHIIELELK
ncbi:MAG: alpha-L-fucosidase, partial [Muribaculaceae bacterium]|nr:alpha-L-fucosidase [Muribaculaceae bacterium]